MQFESCLEELEATIRKRFNRAVMDTADDFMVVIEEFIDTWWTIQWTGGWDREYVDDSKQHTIQPTVGFLLGQQY